MEHKCKRDVSIILFHYLQSICINNTNTRLCTFFTKILINIFFNIKIESDFNFTLHLSLQ